MTSLIADIFTKKPIFGMLHLGGETAYARLANAVREAEIMFLEGVDGVIIENYFGDYTDVEACLVFLNQSGFAGKIGINVLGNANLAFSLAQNYRVDFIQIDSVCGDLPAAQDEIFARKLEDQRRAVSAALFGGVRFKYQPVASGRSEAEDVALAVGRCDAIVVTGVATGAQTDLDKLRRFRVAAGADMPLIIGSGVTAQNAEEQLALAQGAIIGSSLKHNGFDSGMVTSRSVRGVMDQVRRARGICTDPQ